MKTKLNLTIDEELIPISKEYAKSEGVSLSRLVENLLRKVTQKQQNTFSEKWQGQFKEAEKEGERYRKLKKRFLE